MTGAVITYVYMNDPVWQEQYRRTVGGDPLAKRYRDWGTLKYLLRGIATFMPFVRTVHLVVSGKSQVPSWVSGEVHVVEHADIIPEDLLPVFNSTAIEMFLWRIPGLAERFVYFNDDMFPVAPISEDDLYSDGKAAMGYSRHLFAASLYKKQTKASDRLARKALGKCHGVSFIRPQHICSPMLRSVSEEAFKAVEKDILATVTTLREPFNPNQYFFLDYQLFSGHGIRRRLSSKHISLAVNSASDVEAFLHAPSRSLACINDVTMSDESFAALKPRVEEAFRGLLPDKSRFEL